MDSLHDHKIKLLEEKAVKIREDIIKMLVSAGSGHSAGPLGMADVFTALYFHALNHDPKKPNWSERDRVVLSCGHIAPVLYATLAHAGYFPISELKTLRKFGSRLQGHPHRGSLPGIESTSGPLGSGLSQAIGMGLAAKLNHERHKIYCVMSDGEQQEGNVWEAVMFAGKNKLHNVIAIMDRNNIQIDGLTENVMPIEPIAKKYESFNWNVLHVDGHNFEQIIFAMAEARCIVEKPTMIICHTIPGKGVSFMEGDYLWHGKPPKPEEAKVALKELRTLEGKIKSEHD